MTGSSWIVRPVEDSDLESLAALYLLIRGRSRPPAFNRWRLSENPFGKGPSLVAVEKGVCIGVMAHWPAELRLGREKAMGSQGIDALTHPDHRHKGVFLSLVEEGYRIAEASGIVALFAFPNGNSYPIFVKRLNWDHVGDIPMWKRSLRPLWKRCALPRQWPALWRQLASRGAAPDELTVVAGDALPEGFETFLEEVFTSRDICRVNRSRAWYAWRFGPTSELDCEWVSCHRGGRLVACALWGRNKRTVLDPRGGIVYDVLGSDPAAVRAVVRGCVARASGRRLDVLHFFTNDPVVSGVITEAGFLQVARNPLVVRKQTTRTLGGNIHHFPSWRLMTADHDTY